MARLREPEPGVVDASVPPPRWLKARTRRRGWRFNFAAPFYRTPPVDMAEWERREAEKYLPPGPKAEAEAQARADWAGLDPETQARYVALESSPQMYPGEAWCETHKGAAGYCDPDGQRCRTTKEEDPWQ